MFEEGIVAVRSGNEIREYERIAVVSAHEKADFTEIKQVLDYTLKSLDFKYEI